MPDNLYFNFESNSDNGRHSPNALSDTYIIYIQLWKSKVIHTFTLQLILISLYN